MTAPVIHWFRRDLRLEDNLALAAAARSGAPVVPVFIFDPAILGGRYFSAARFDWLLANLRALDADLRAQGSRLVCRRGDPRQTLPELVRQTGAAAVYANRDYTPLALRRDAQVERALTVPLRLHDDGLLLPPGEVLKPDGAPFTVFTPFKKRWLTLPKAQMVPAPPGAAFAPIAALDSWMGETAGQPPTLADFGLRSGVTLPEPGAAAARRRLAQFLSERGSGYRTSRDFLASDPDDDTRGGWSFMSPYFRFGLISPRQAYWAARDAYTALDTPQGRESIEHYVSELVWREFYAHILWHFPHALRRSFRPAFDALPWRAAPGDLQAWKDGLTGYPVVDAALRQLQTMGWMPNRARMIVASFLSKDLLVDWRAGELHFMQWLIDGDPAQNNGGWQWAAGTGTDAQPYFRVFNPVMQSQKFDPDGAYIRRWLPELRDVPAAFIHAPWTMPTPPRDYPAPLVDHHHARDRALAAFAAIKAAQP